MSSPLKQYITDLVAPLLVATRASYQNIISKVSNWEKLSPNTHTDHGIVSETSITPDVNLGIIHSYTFDQAAVTLNFPTLPEGVGTCQVTLYLETTQPDTWVTLGPGLHYVYNDSDGLAILQGQSYMYTLDIRPPSMAHVRTYCTP